MAFNKFLFCFRYRERIVWTDKALNLKLLRKGILTRIYAPMVSWIVSILSCLSTFKWPIILLKRCMVQDKLKCLSFYLQVIIQGLRNSGIFSSVISSAVQNTLAKDQFLSSAESSNSSRRIESGGLSSRKVGINRGDSQATARKVLEIVDNLSDLSAIPPLSPPSLDEDVPVPVDT